MTKSFTGLALVPAAGLSFLLACGASNPPTTTTAVGGATGESGTTGSAGTGAVSGATSSVGGTSAAGAGGGGASGISGSTSIAGTGGASGAGAGAGGAVAAGGAPSGGVRTGNSLGCGMAPPGTDSSKNFVTHEVHMTGLDPVYLKGGMYYDSNGQYNLTFRPYSVRLPTNYDPTKPYTVTFGGGGCGGNASDFATNPSGGLQIAGNGTTIEIGLSYLGGCFNDGGPAIGNRTDTPEEPYFRAIMKDIEAHYCIDLSKVFLGGYSSGGWESYTLGCAASDLIRGIGAQEGGLRTMHPTCKGPVAAVLVAGEADTENPIGPLDPNNAMDLGAINRLGSLGSAPGRDDILKRNNCVGTATAPADPAYSACVKYTGCPPQYPVVWCALPGVTHNSSTYNNVDYSPGPMWGVLGALPPP